jgi:hypothetical protein
VSSPPHRALMVLARRRGEYRWAAVLGRGCSRTGTRSGGGTTRQASGTISEDSRLHLLRPREVWSL